MPRYAREQQKSYSGIYHIILRGINQQEIFLDDMDRKKFLIELKKIKEMYSYEIYAYVLMNNHIHILIKEEDNISKIIQSLTIRYAMYFNKKYERIGHLFYNRFKSKCVENTGYLLNVVKYIHKNPQKEGICKMDKYRWSSYNEYLGKSIITDTAFILSMFNENSDKAIEEFMSYHTVVDDWKDIEEIEMINALSDDEAILKIKERLKIDNIMEIQKYKANHRDEIIRRILDIKGINKTQLARVIGVSKRTIYRAINK